MRDRLATQAGRNLFGALIAMTGDRDHRSWFDQVKAIEDEAIALIEPRWGDGDAGEAAVRADFDAEEREALALLERVPPFDENDRIVAMNGTVRTPRTPADYVDAYRTRLFAALGPKRQR